MTANENPEDRKPDVSEHINVKVVSDDKNEVFFKIKKTTQLRKLMDAWCERQGKSSTSVRFLYDGQRVQPHQTPEELEMEEGDALDVMMEQIGGCL